MPREYQQLARHNSVCNEVYYKFQDCERENPLKRYLGVCTDLQREVNKCIKANREYMRQQNRLTLKERLERINQKSQVTG